MLGPTRLIFYRLPSGVPKAKAADGLQGLIARRYGFT
jgi:hypothetical protein